MAGDGENEGAELRVSDAERERTIELLKRQTGSGHLTLDEFSERAGQAWAASSKGQLEQLTRDLPTDAIAVPEGRRLPSTRWTVAVMGSSSRKGRWRVAPRSNALNVMGGCYLDLRNAEFSGDDILINVATVMGSVDIVVPEGIEVELSGIPLMGSKELRVRDVPPIPGSPRVQVRALAIMGSVSVRSRPRNSANDSHLSR